MTGSMVRHLVLKDWYLNRWVLLSYIAGGAISLAVMVSGSQSAFYFGSVLLLSTLIGVGIHLVMATVINERKHQTLAFVMSLPITPVDYTSAKVAANVGAFSMAWMSLLLATAGTILALKDFPNGILPFAVILLVEIFVAYCLQLGVALVSESEGWTIFAIVACNLFLNFFLYATSKMPAIEQHMTGPTPVWNSTIVSILVAEGVALVLILGATFFLQARKREFI